MKTRLIQALLPVLMLMGACSTERDPSELFAPSGVGTLVVDAVLIIDRPMPEVLLSRTQSPLEPDAQRSGFVDGASVSIALPDRGEEILYLEDSDRPGVYLPSSRPLVEPGTTYALRVVTGEGEILGASTTTPEALAIDRWLLLDDTGNEVRGEFRSYEELGDAVYSAAENQVVYAQGLIEARFEPGSGPGYQIGIFSLDEDADFVIDPDFFEEEDFEDLERSISSPALLGEGGTLRLPWFAIFFEGRYQLKILAVDDNWFDYVRSVPQNGGFAFGGQAGDNFDLPIFHVDGGIGLFGSAAVDSIGFTVLPRP